MKIQNPKSFLPLLACMVVVLVWFSPWWLGGKNLAPLDLQNRMMSPWRGDNATRFAKNHNVADGVDQYLVYRLIAEKSYREEGWVGWSSLTYGGTAQYANTMALYYDWTMQLHRWFKFWTAWHLGLMGQVMLAAAGMYFFLRGRSVPPLWACCGALAYAANSQFMTWIYHRWALGSFCWVPWVLWAIDRYRNGNRGAWPLVPVFIALAFLGGTLQHAALVVLAVAAIWLEEVILEHSKSRIQNPESRIPSLWKILLRYATWGTLGMGLAAMMFLPCAAAFLTSNRLGLHTGMTANATDSIYPGGPLQPLLNLAAYPLQWFPSILGRCDSLDLLKLFKSELFYVAYFGSLPVIIALIAIWRKRSPILARILIALGLLLPLTPLVRFLYQRLFLLFILGGILAFTHFMQTAARDTRIRLFRIMMVFTSLGVVAWSIASIGLWLNPDIQSRLREKILSVAAGSSFGFFSEWISARTDRFIGDLFIWSPQQSIPLLLMLAGLIGLRYTASYRETMRRFGAWLVVLAVLCEISLFGSRWVVWADPATDPMFTETAETQALKEIVGRTGRVTTLIDPVAHMARTPFIPNTLAPYGIATISGYDSIVPDGMILPNESAGDADRLGRLGVSHLITALGNTDVPHGWTQVWQSPSMTLHENTLSFPKVMGFQTDDEKDDFLRGIRPPFREIKEKEMHENHRLMDLPADTAWVRLAENHADGWEYRIPPSNQWLPVQRAPDASMLMENSTPQKTTELEMRYNPPLRRLGFLISGLSVILTALASLYIAIRPGRTASVIAG